MSRNYENSNLVNNDGQILQFEDNINQIPKHYAYLSEKYYYSIKCKNNKVCNGLLPDRWFEVRGKYLCISCERDFGNLNKNCTNG